MRILMHIRLQALFSLPATNSSGRPGMREREDPADELEREQQAEPKPHRVADDSAEPSDPPEAVAPSVDTNSPDATDEPPAGSAPEDFELSTDFEATMPDRSQPAAESDSVASADSLPPTEPASDDAGSLPEVSGDDLADSSAEVEAEPAATESTASALTSPWESLLKPPVPGEDRMRNVAQGVEGQEPSLAAIEASLAEMKGPPAGFAPIAGGNTSDEALPNPSDWLKGPPRSTSPNDPSAHVDDLVYRPDERRALSNADYWGQKISGPAVQLLADTGNPEPPDGPGDTPPRSTGDSAHPGPDAALQAAPRVMMVVTVNNVDRIVAEELDRAARSIAGTCQEVVDAALHEQVTSQRAALRAVGGD